MSTALANAIVVIAIVVSALYAVWRLGPRSMRDAVRMRLSKSMPGVFGKLSSSSSGGACDGCGSGCETTTSQPAARKEHAVIWRKKASP